MPMVPSLNSNLPNVAERPSFGETVSPSVAHLNPDARLEIASRAGDALADNLSKIAALQRGYETKAASADADSRAMELINDELMNPETGYFTQTGKNAVDAYQATMERIQNGLTEIGDSVPGQVRDAVKAKLDDRLASAMGRAASFRFEQTRSYMQKSVQSNLDALTDDYAQNFANKEYGGKTMMSMWDQVQTLGKMQGMDDQQIEQLARGQYDLAESKRYTAWAAVDPRAALADFQANKGGISADVASKIEQSLFERSRGQLIGGLVQGGGLAASNARLGATIPQGSPTFGTLNTKTAPDASAKVTATLGCRNNNPLNIRVSNDRWVGQAADDDSGFARFASPEAGVRAAAKCLLNYQKLGIDTPSAIVNRWCPASDCRNDVPSYVKNVCQSAGFKPDQKLDLSDRDTMRRLIVAMMQQEIGGNPYADDVIDAGIAAGFGAALPQVSSGPAVASGTGAVTGSSPSDKWMIDPRVPTGDPIVDALPLNQKLAVMQEVFSAQSAKRSTERADMTRQIANSVSTFRDTGSDENALTADQFIQVYGQKDGVTLYEDYRAKAASAAAVHGMAKADAQTITSTLAALKPVPGDPNYAEKSKDYLTVERAAASVMEARRKDPVGQMVALGWGGFAPINIADPENVALQLRARAEALSSNVQRLGAGGDALLTKDEARRLVGVLDKLPVDNLVSYMTAIHNGAGNAGVPLLVSQLKSGNKNYALALSAMGDRPNGSVVSTGEKYLRGMDAIGQKRIQIPTGVNAPKSILYNALGDDADGAAVFDNPEVLDQTVDLAYGVWGYNAAIGSPSSAEEALESAVGSVKVVNGKKVIVPRGVYTSSILPWRTDFGDEMKKTTAEIRKSDKTFYVFDPATGINKSLTSAKFSELLPRLQLQTFRNNEGGSISYKVISGGRYVTIRNGKTNEDAIITLSGK